MGLVRPAQSEMERPYATSSSMGGSGFAGELSKDILAHSELQDSVIALCDLKQSKVKAVAQYVRRIIDEYELPAKVEQGTDLRKLLPEATSVIMSISAGESAYTGFPANMGEISPFNTA